MNTISRTAKFAVSFEGWRETDLKGPKKDTKDGLWRDIWTAQNELTMAANKLISALYQVMLGTLKHPVNEKTGKPVSLKSLAYKGLSGDWQPFGHPLYQPTRRGVSSNVLLETASRVFVRLTTDYKDIVRGKKALANFRELPIAANGQGAKVENGLIRVNVWASRSRDWWTDEVKERTNEGSKVTFRPYGVRNGQAAILKRCFEGEYKTGSLSFHFNQRRKKWMLCLSWTGDVIERTGDLIAGVDTGISTAATVSYVDKNTGKAAWQRAFIRIPDNVFRAWRRLRKERIQRLQFNRATAGLRSGKGQHRKLRVDSIGDKISRITDTAIKQVAANVVNECLRNGATAIAVENLKHWSQARMLKDTEHLEGKKRAGAREAYKVWHHGALRVAITQAAEREGLKVYEINPRNTSTTCSACGENYPKPKGGGYNKEFGRISQAKFKCECGFEDHADRNAAINIARRGLEASEEEKKKKAA